ncbi:uncharacterized protein [Gossypium hirsutum]|uniref:HAT C-terminal dimerisation domain-containing protein n=1 Tax=Gossypium hirsutum TaxID=3635 RepID=A0ABM2YPN3_GOSHI|nr:uncharacterized protein LOC121204972 [Gossypium hirsutum]
MTMASSNSPIPVDDGFNEYESAPKHQKSTTSKVWDEITKLECENKNELKAQCNHSSESAFSMGKKVITPLRSSLKPKTIQAVVCLDDWMRAKGFLQKLVARMMMTMKTMRMMRTMRMMFLRLLFRFLVLFWCCW